jgi:hypothetical protein
MEVSVFFVFFTHNSTYMDTVKKIIRWIFVTLGVLGILIFCFLYFANYSKGYRAGVPIKVSYKGNIIKTWEGEMNIGGLTSSSEGVIPTTWTFTVKKSDKEVLEMIDDAIEKGQRVKLYYNEKYVRFFWLGDTKYFVYDVEPIE